MKNNPLEQAPLNRYEAIAQASEAKIRSLEATDVLLEVVASGDTLLNGAPIEEILARKLGIEGWDRLGALREVEGLLSGARDVIATNIKALRASAADARSMITPAGAGETIAEPREYLN